MLFLIVITEEIASAEGQDGQDGQDAFERFFRDFFDKVVWFFSRRGCQPEECQDLAQETFLRAYRSLDNFRGDAKTSTWLITIATNVWLNRVRDDRASKRAADEVPLPEDDLAPPALDQPPLEETIGAERRQLLRSAVDELPDGMRHCVLLRVYQDMSYRDIADVLGISVATAKSQVSRARPQLKLVLAEHYPELESRLDEGKR